MHQQGPPGRCATSACTNPVGPPNRAGARHHPPRRKAGTPVQWQRTHCWLYGAVEVPSGQSLFYLFSHLDAVCFQRFLDHLAQQCSALQCSSPLASTCCSGTRRVLTSPPSCSGPPRSCQCFSHWLVPSGAGSHRALVAGA
jgi:hypothetical protein